jgi:hypothetical protein
MEGKLSAGQRDFTPVAGSILSTGKHPVNLHGSIFAFSRRALQICDTSDTTTSLDRSASRRQPYTVDADTGLSPERNSAGCAPTPSKGQPCLAERVDATWWMPSVPKQ